MRDVPEDELHAACFDENFEEGENIEDRDDGSVELCEITDSLVDWLSSSEEEEMDCDFEPNCNESSNAYSDETDDTAGLSDGE